MSEVSLHRVAGNGLRLRYRELLDTHQTKLGNVANREHKTFHRDRVVSPHRENFPCALTNPGMIDCIDEAHCQMSMIHVNLIAASLQSRFESCIDTSDVKQKDPEKRASQMLSRALAAFAIAALAKTTDDDAARSVVDEYNDDGIDAFYLSATDHVCFIVQSKWPKGGSSSLDLASSLNLSRV